MKRILISQPKASLKNKCLAAAAGSFVLLTIGAPYVPSPKVELPTAVPGQLATGVEPKLCIGYDQLKQQWGAEYGYCPANHAFFGVDDPAGDAGPAEKISVSMACCELPAADVLSEEHVFVPDSCPTDYIATGSSRSETAEGTLVQMRCTKINTDRYQLGEMTRGVYWGDGAAGWRGSRRIDWDNIPASMRYAHGRQTVAKWDIDGCVGYPWGSLLTKKESKHCAGFGFKQLQFRGAQADPAAGTPVKMLPDCETIEHLDAPEKVRCGS